MQRQRALVQLQNYGQNERNVNKKRSKNTRNGFKLRACATERIR